MIRRAVASLLIVVHALLTPGGRFYEACAQTVAGQASRAGISGTIGVVGTLALPLGAPSLLAPALQPSLNGVLSAPAAPAPLASLVVPVAAVPSALASVAPVLPAAAQAIEVSAVISAAQTPRTFAQAKTGEAAAVLFDRSVTRTGALDDALSVPASESDAQAELSPAKTPVPGAPSEPPAPRAKLPRSMWGLFFGHHIMTVFGVNFHMLSQPFLVKDALGMGTATMGLVRNIHMGSMALVNALPIGYLIDKTDYRVVFVATSLARAALMAAIPLLFMAGGLHFTVLAAIVAINPIFQSTMIVADGAARRSFLGKDEKLNKDAAATLGKWDSIAGALMPIIAGWVVGLLVTGFGLGGYAMAYGVYGGLLIASIPFYWYMVRDPRFAENDKLSPAKFAAQTIGFMGALAASVVHPFTALLTWAYRSFFKHERPDLPEALGSRVLWALREALIILAGAALLPLASLKALWGLPSSVKKVKAAAAGKSLADLLDAYKPMQGVAYILRNKTLRILTMVMALEVLLIDALPFVVIPSLITDAMGAIPAVLSAGGVMGLLFSVEYIGRLIPSMRMEGEKGDKIIEKQGHAKFYKRAAISSLLFWALLAPAFLTMGMFWLNLAIVSGVLFGVQFFQTPVGIIMEPVKRAEMDDDKLARIESAVFMVDVAFESIGALLLGLLLDWAGLRVALIAVAAFLTLTAVLQYQVPKWIFPDGNRPAKKTPPPSQGQ